MIQRDPLPRPIAEIPWMGALHQFMERQGYVRALGSRIALGDHPTVIALSDYGGKAGRCCYETYGFVYVGHRALEQWHKGILALKRRTLRDNRTIRYKDLGDERRQAALPEWLSLSNNLQGLLIVIAVHKRIPHLFVSNAGRPLNALFAEQGFPGYSDALAERSLRILHMLCYFAALMLRPKNKFFWKTDEDDIAGSGGASPRLEYLGELFQRVMNLYIAHQLVECGYAAALSDDKNRFFEDGLSIPDLAVGACADFFSKVPQICQNQREEIISWLVDNHAPLQKIIFRFDFDCDGPNGDVQFRIELVQFRKTSNLDGTG